MGRTKKKFEHNSNPFYSERRFLSLQILDEPAGVCLSVCLSGQFGLNLVI